MRAYAQSVVSEEWPRMQEGKRAAGSETALTSLLSAIVDAPPSGNSGAAVQRARFDLVLKLHTLRETRLELAGDHTDEIKWAALLIIGLGLVAVQERPFARPLEVSPEPLADVVHEIPAR